MTEATPTKSPEELRAELDAKRAQLGDTVEELAHRVDVPAQVKARKDDAVARLQDARAEATRRVQEGTEKVRTAIADKTPVVQQRVDDAVTRSKAVYADKAPPAVQRGVDQAVTKGKTVYAEKAPVVAHHVNKAVADARPVVQEKVAPGPGRGAPNAPPGGPPRGCRDEEPGRPGGGRALAAGRRDPRPEPASLRQGRGPARAQDGPRDPAVPLGWPAGRRGHPTGAGLPRAGLTRAPACGRAGQMRLSG